MRFDELELCLQLRCVLLRFAQFETQAAQLVVQRLLMRELQLVVGFLQIRQLLFEFVALVLLVLV